MIAYTLTTIAVAFLVAFLWSKSDARRIAANIAGGRFEGLNHTQLLFWRCSVLVIGLVIAWACLRWLGSPDWKVAVTATLAFGAFVPSHRLLLNKWRGKNWRYMGSTYGFREADEAKYDGMWQWISWKRQGSEYTADGIPYVHSNVVAGTLAYSFEIIVALASILTLTLA